MGRYRGRGWFLGWPWQIWLVLGVWVVGMIVIGLENGWS